MEILLPHLMGDFLLQNQWMADNKQKSSLACAVHCLVYTLCYYAWFLATIGVVGYLVIFATHFVIDRFGLALVWMRCYGVGFRNGRPIDNPNLLISLRIVVDNTMHLLINYAALGFFSLL